MKTKVAILVSLTLAISLFVSTFANADCNTDVKNKLSQLPNVLATASNESNFLIITNATTPSNLENIKTVAKSLFKSSLDCDLSNATLTISTNELNIVASSKPKLKKSDLTKLLYAYVYSLSPVQVEANLTGYKKLVELVPSSKYYAARVKHYEERIALLEARKNFIKQCFIESKKDENIKGLNIYRDYYLIVANTDTPEKTATDFLEKVAKKTPRPDKNLCLFIYSKNLAKVKEICEEKMKPKALKIEEKLLLQHVKAMPSFKIISNAKGYEALLKLNPDSSFYSEKKNFYSLKEQQFLTFIKVKDKDSKNIITDYSFKKGSLYITLNEQIQTPAKMAKALCSYYEHAGAPVKSCIINSSAGKQVGSITANTKGRCFFK